MDYHDGTPMLAIADYAEHAGVHPRTVKRWLAENELPGATKDSFSGEWRIPVDATRRPAPVWTSKAELAVTEQHLPAPAGTEMVWHQPQPQPADAGEPTRLESLAEEATFLTVPEAAYYLGIPQKQILANAELFEVMTVGFDSSPRVPKRVIRKFEGA